MNTLELLHIIMYRVQSLLIRASKVRDESAKIKKLKVNAKYIVRNYISKLNSHIISLSFGIGILLIHTIITFCNFFL